MTAVLIALLVITSALLLLVTLVQLLYMESLRLRARDLPALQLFKDRLQGFFRVWDAQLANRKYAAGAELSVADLSLYAGYARTKGAQPALLEGLPNLARWADEMAARPAVQRAIKF